MYKRFKSWLSIKKTERPDLIVLLSILFLNIVLICITAFIISGFNLKGTEGMTFFEAIFYTISMIFDAGCISYVVEDIGSTSVFIVFLCLAVCVTGMVTFTGAVIGYVTNFISSFIEDADNSKQKLYLSNHIIIVGWNNKGNEIISDLLYKDSKNIVVVFVSENKDQIKKEIREHLEDFVEKDDNLDLKKCKRKLKVLVKQGDLYSSSQLKDICVEKASTVIILENESEEESFEEEQSSTNIVANSQIIKSTMQVADICSSVNSIDNQNIIVECSENWTYEILKKVADYKTVEGKCRIIALPVKRLLGNLMAQLTIMSDLNLIYDELFSSNGVTLTCKQEPEGKDLIQHYLNNHQNAIPLGSKMHKGKNYNYYACNSLEDIDKKEDVQCQPLDIKINPKFQFNKKNIVVMGHNHNFHDILRGFMSYYNETKDKDSISVTVIDNRKSIEQRGKYLKAYPFVKEIVAADINERAVICETLNKCLDKNKNTNILILSDDREKKEDIDTVALTNLIYVQDVIHNKKKEGFDDSYIDIIVEIVNPKHYDVVRSYSVNNVVISSRFISKMIMQIGIHEALYKFFKDILTYDKIGSAVQSKEIYVKSANHFLKNLPSKCNAKDLIRTIYELTYKKDPQILLGYIRDNKQVLFGGKQENVEVELQAHDKLIIYSCK